MAVVPHKLISISLGQQLNLNSTLKASNGRHMKALEVFSHSINYLHKRALEVIRERTGDEHFTSRDIQWVLTVPAIWKPAAKQFMREAAYKVSNPRGVFEKFYR